ncbi:LysR family transcriptional regulator [Roseovarius sp. EL26]|uniref:LysR family transcriptional regulator n=1 Tax=Roseovarius sp. EL26 TaxID=2126672 RepID=UPI000EA321BD|nr:LysR family transcriptional regulator [Roseovarius sp. EL26]
MKLEWIEDILAVAETGSFSAAAERRFLTASAFTRRIRAMEEALGCALFDRNRKPVTLLPHVQAMEFELRESARNFRELRLALSDDVGLHGRRLTLVCQHALTTMVAPWLVRQLGQGREGMLRIRSGSRAECYLMMMRQDADFGLIYETAEDAREFDHELYDKISLGTEEFIPVANRRHHPDIEAAISSKDLPLITYPAGIYLGEVLRVQILPYVSREFSTFSAAETGLTPAVLQFIRQGVGIGWLPRSVAFESMIRGELDSLQDILPSTRLTVQAVRTRSGSREVVDKAWESLRRDAGSIQVDGITAPSIFEWS